MPKALSKSVAFGISTLRVGWSLAEFLLVRNIVIERVVEFPVEEHFEAEDDEDGRGCGHPEKRFEASNALQPDGYERTYIKHDSVHIRQHFKLTEHEEKLHHNNGNEQAIDHHIPETLYPAISNEGRTNLMGNTHSTAFNLGRADIHQLILVDPGTDPEDNCRGCHNQRCKWCKDQCHSAHEQNISAKGSLISKCQVDKKIQDVLVDRKLEIHRFGPFPNISWCATEHAAKYISLQALQLGSKARTVF